MRKCLWLFAMAAMPAMAELSQLTPSQEAQLKEMSKAEQAMLERQMKALARVQERVARRYRETHPGKESAVAISEVKEQVDKGDIPKSATQPIGTPGKPHAGRQLNPQAEAHSQSSQ